jgi:serine/threonine protein kinase/tetratricopeptide (TPR) repeat protein
VERLHLDEEQWRYLLPLLDQAMDLSGADRDTLLVQLDREQSEVARSLRALLEELAEVKASHFLEGTPVHVADESLRGQAVGAYTIESLIGRGGMGEVWRAHRSDGRFERKVAVKLIHAWILSRRAAERFEQEGRVLARLTHPNIATLMDAGVTADSRPYIVLEYIEGESIDCYCDARALGVQARLELFLDVLAAVSHAQSNLVVHRDLKPSNVLVTRDGVVKLLDFGIAKLMDSETDTEAGTRLGELALTPEYAAPEQLLGEPVSTATDVYQLGVLLHMLLAGCLPYARSMTRGELVRLMLDSEPPLMSDGVMRLADAGKESVSNSAERRVAVRRLRAALRGDLDAIVAKTLQRDVGERYSSAATLAEDLQRHLRHEPVVARAGAFRYRASKFARRYRGTLLTAAAVAVGLIATTVVALLHMREARIQRDEAFLQAQRAEAQRRFTTLMLTQIGTDGRTASLEEVIDKGVILLDKQFGDDPTFVVDMLIGLSGRYMDLGKTHKEHAVLVKAEALARKLGPLPLATVQCNTVETEIALGDLRAAKARMREGAAALATVPKPDFHDVVDCLGAQTRLSLAEGRFDEAIQYGKRAATLLEKGGETRSIQYTAVLSKIEFAYIESGNPIKATEILRSQQLASQQAGRAGMVTTQLEQHNEARDLAEMGQTRDALAIERRVIEHGLSDDARVTLLYGNLLLRMEQPAEALRWLDLSLKSSRAEEDVPRLIIGSALRSRALLALGRFDEATAALPDPSTFEGGTDTASRSARVQVGILRADFFLASNQVAQAAMEIDRVLAEVRAAKDLVRWEPSALLTAARIAMGDQRIADAVRYATDALRIYERRTLEATHSADVGESLLTLATAQKSAGDRRLTEDTVRRAYEALRHSLGPDHSLTRTAAAMLQAPNSAVNVPARAAEIRRR